LWLPSRRLPSPSSRPKSSGMARRRPSARPAAHAAELATQTRSNALAAFPISIPLPTRAPRIDFGGCVHAPIVEPAGRLLHTYDP
jgi:hypothetical protein